VKISPAEAVIMEALWTRSPATAEQIAAQVAQAQDWGEATVKTLINRLLKKGAVQAEPDGRRYLYRPLLERAHYIDHESRNLLDRLFEGRLAPLVSHFSEGGKLSEKEVAELRRLIEKLDT
jgi:BlaI family penicillinase repressor